MIFQHISLLPWDRLGAPRYTSSTPSPIRQNSRGFWVAWGIFKTNLNIPTFLSAAPHSPNRNWINWDDIIPFLSESSNDTAGSLFLLLPIYCSAFGSLGGLLKRRLSTASLKDSSSSKDILIWTRTKIIVGAIPWSGKCYQKTKEVEINRSYNNHI